MAKKNLEQKMKMKKTIEKDHEMVNKMRIYSMEQGSIRSKELALSIGENEFNVANMVISMKKKDEACCIWSFIVCCTTRSDAAHCNYMMDDVCDNGSEIVKNMPAKRYRVNGGL